MSSFQQSEKIPTLQQPEEKMAGTQNLGGAGLTSLRPFVEDL